MHFCCHTTKSMFYERVFDDNTFLDKAGDELRNILQQEINWCKQSAVENPHNACYMKWRDEKVQRMTYYAASLIYTQSSCDI